jgi:maleate isomerase
MTIRKRIGLILPSCNTAAEPDYRMVAPDGVTIHTHRMFIGNEGPMSEIMDRMNEDMEQAARYLSTANVDLIVYACTTGSFYRGWGFDQEMIKTIEDIGGVPVVATATAAAEALKVQGAEKVSVTTPYPDWSNERLAEYYRAAGFEVLNVDGEPNVVAAGGYAISDRDPEEILEFSTEKCQPEADAHFCSCTAWRSLEVAAELERRLSRPVVTSNQATIWASFKRLDIDPRPGFGSLLDSLVKAPV